MLEYPNHVLKERENGAEHALKRFEKLSGDTKKRIKTIAQERSIVLP